MIGVLTLNSILTRIREIGILRAIGASKSDIARIFNAETIIIGFASGVIGISIAFILIIPVNLCLDAFTNTGAAAYLDPKAALILVGISTFLTYIAGLIPSKTAANKNPVDALRTE
jgi:ABC-type antimicrobial peptide transport system permease subunit